MDGNNIVSIIIAIVLGMTVLGAFLGLIRKWKKALLRFGIVVLDLILALLATNRALAEVPTDITTITTEPKLVDLFTNVPSLLTLAGGLAKPFAFMVIFLCSSVLSLIFYWILLFFIRYKKDEKKYPMVGMLIGAVQGLVLAIVLVSPIVGYISLADDAVTSYHDVVGEEVPTDIAELHKTYVAPVEEHAFVGLIETVSSPIFNTLVSFKLGDDTFNPEKEVPILLAAYHNATVLGGLPIAEYGNDQKNAISGITTLFDQSVLLPNVGADFLSALGTKWCAGEDLAGIGPLAVEGDLEPLIEALYSVLATTTSDTLRTDVVTIGDFLILMVDYGMTGLLDGNADVLAEVTKVNPATGKTFIKAATELLDANPHMATLRAGITKLGASLLGSQLGTSEEIRENYGEMVTDVVDILKDLEGDTNEEKIAALTPTIKEELLKNDIDLSEEIVDEASKFLIEELDKENVSIEDMTEEDIYNILDKIAAGEITIPLP